MEWAWNSDSKTPMKKHNRTSGTDLSWKSLCCIFLKHPVVLCLKVFAGYWITYWPFHYSIHKITWLSFEGVPYQQVVVLNYLQNVRHFSGLMGDFSVHLSYGRRRWVKLNQSWLEMTLDKKFTPVSMCPTGTRMKESCTGFSGLAIRQSSCRPVEK